MLMAAKSSASSCLSAIVLIFGCCAELIVWTRKRSEDALFVKGLLMKTTIDVPTVTRGTFSIQFRVYNHPIVLKPNYGPITLPSSIFSIQNSIFGLRSQIVMCFEGSTRDHPLDGAFPLGQINTCDLRVVIGMRYSPPLKRHLSLRE